MWRRRGSLFLVLTVTIVALNGGCVDIVVDSVKDGIGNAISNAVTSAVSAALEALGSGD